MALFLAIALVVSLASGCPAPPVTPVVDTDWLAKNLDKVTVVDVRPAADYDKDFIPGAVHLPPAKLQTDVPVEGIVLAKDKIESALEAAGISKDKHVVVYGKTTDPTASLVMWILNYHGHTRVSLLDGGYAKWTKEGRSVTTTKPTITKTIFDAKLNPAIYATKEEMLAAIEGVKKKTHVIVDVRTPDEYVGKVLGKGVKRGGHIPGAVLIDDRDLVKDGVFKPLAELKTMVEAKGITKDKHIFVYCRTGTRSTLLYVVLYHLLDYKKVENYDGSMVEWSLDEKLPLSLAEKLVEPGYK